MPSGSFMSFVPFMLFLFGVDLPVRREIAGPAHRDPSAYPGSVGRLSWKPVFF